MRILIATVLTAVMLAAFAPTAAADSIGDSVDDMCRHQQSMRAVKESGDFRRALDQANKGDAQSIAAVRKIAGEFETMLEMANRMLAKVRELNMYDYVNRDHRDKLTRCRDDMRSVSGYVSSVAGRL